MKGKTLLIFLCVLCVSVVNLSCSRDPTDLRALAPADALVYLETRDLGKTLNALTESRAFQQLAKAPADFSPLAGMQAAVVVTGFEASENQVTEENAVLDFRPRFVALADTHAWNYQTVAFVETRLGEFVNENYGGEVVLDRTGKAGGQSFVWTAADGRKAFAFVVDSKILFSNDETALEKALAVFRGEAESLAKAGKTVDRGGDGALALGYVSPDGVAQLANLAGVSTAIAATEDDDGRGFIARVLPQLMRGAVKEIFWSAAMTEQGIEDRYELVLTPETTTVFKETLVAPNAPSETATAEFIPSDIETATRYRLQNPQIAWRSLLLVAGKNTDAMSAQVLTSFAGSVFEPYNVTDAEGFLSAIGGEIWTAALDAEGERAFVAGEVKDAETLKKSLAEFDFKRPAEKQFDADVWKSADGAQAAAFLAGRFVLGDAEAVAKALQARQGGRHFAKSQLFARFRESRAAAVTVGRDATEKVVEALAEKRAENMQMTTNYLIETRFTERGAERKTISPFGLLGRIIEQFDN